MSKIRPHLTYANVMVTLLAFVVLGGVAVAGVKGLKKNSVGTKQIKNGAVTRAKIKKGAVDGSRLSSSALDGYARTSALDGYAKDSDLGGYAKLPVGPDELAAVPAASLSGAIYNVGPGGIDCQGTENKAFPTGSPDDIDFSTIDFDHGGLVQSDPGAAPECFNGFTVSQAGTYVITAWVAWAANETGDREILITAHNPGEGPANCCPVSISETAANDSGPSNTTSQTVAAVARLAVGGRIFLGATQTSPAPLGFYGGGLQIARLGS